MPELQTIPAWRRQGFLLRLLVSYFVIPAVPPVVMLVTMQGSGRMGFGDWMGIVLLYGIFGFAAMVALGTPLLLCFLRLGWTGFVPFITGGGLCAGTTSYAVLRGGHWGEVELFTITGLVSGLFFQMILFGFR
jgi:hypothetical protein